jgi:hypothetical protein
MSDYCATRGHRDDLLTVALYAWSRWISCDPRPDVVEPLVIDDFFFRQVVAPMFQR